MSRHLVTVCMVCLLCTTHTHCSAHNDISDSYLIPQGPKISDKLSSLDKQPQLSRVPMGLEGIGHTKNGQSRNLNSIDKDNRTARKRGSLRVYDSNNGQKLNRMQIVDRSSVSHTKRAKQPKHVQSKGKQALSSNDPTFSKRREIMKRLTWVDRVSEDTENSGVLEKNRLSKARLKRHAHGHANAHASGVEIDERYFTKKLFETYGDGATMTLEGFQKLLQKLGIKLLPEYNEGGEHSTEIGGSDDSESHASSHNGPLVHTRTNNSTTLPDWLFERVCPALVYQLAADTNEERNDCFLHVPTIRKSIAADSYTAEDTSRHSAKVWIYSSISILIISLCGLFGVAVIPVMGKTYYHQLLQFLVALAIGTLCGDALIHLLPHAMMSSAMQHHENGHDHDHSSSIMEVNDEDHEAAHNENMWKGLVAMIGLVLFFFTEKGLNMIAECRKSRQRRNKLPARVRVMREPEGGPANNTVGEKLCKHKYSSYPYCYGEITTETQDNHHDPQHKVNEKPPAIEEEKPLTADCNSELKIAEKKGDEDWKLDRSIVNNIKKNGDGIDLPLSETESYTVIIREHETDHHGHTHSHGHVHSAPDSMSSVAWMVVMGDGLHNFTDGMAIGAAFAANIAGGFSTSIAVFCHELPHEIGDFAVLLKAGMSAKQAIFYNLLSSVLCLLGMVFGVLIGESQAATSWVFAAAAGMFIYIALVDMIPELSSNHSVEGGSQWQCVFQASGITTGLGIMLIIALYEHDLKHIFSD